MYKYSDKKNYKMTKKSKIHIFFTFLDFSLVPSMGGALDSCPGLKPFLRMVNKRKWCMCLK